MSRAHSEANRGKMPTAEELAAKRAEHYKSVAAVYETAWCYQEQGDCQKFLCKEVEKLLVNLAASRRARGVKHGASSASQPGRQGGGGEGTPEGRHEALKVTDLGCGTASFSSLLVRSSPSMSGALCSWTVDGVTTVEPSAEMAAKAHERGIQVAVEDALAWARGGEDPPEDRNKRSDVLLLKEVRHHFDDPAAVYAALVKNRLKADGLLVLITRPDSSREVYPFPERGHTNWELGNPVPLEAHVEALRGAGLANLRVIEAPFKVEMPKEEWARLLRARFWSNLHDVPDADVAEFVQGLDGESISFQDRFLFVVGDLLE